MRSAAAAIAWELGRRHRRGLLALLGAILALAIIKLVAIANHFQLDDRDITFALLVPVPLCAGFVYLLAVFTFGIAGDLGARQSMYPRRMFTLPVPSAALAGWPMLYGCGAASLLWLAVRAAGIFPRGVVMPVYWPALFAASLVAWTQALTWMPYPIRGVRVAAAIALLISIDVVAMVALELKVTERTMLLLLAPCVPLAYATAVAGVRRARCGDVPRWLTGSPRTTGRSRVRRSFASAARAQFWFEFRQFGWSLPLLVGSVVPFAALLLPLFRNTSAVVIEIVFGSLLIPPFLAVFVAATAGRSGANPTSTYGISPFVATRPIEDSALVAAKWQAALVSTLLAWGVAGIVLAIGLYWSGAAAPILNLARDIDSALGTSRSIALGVLILAALMSATWKQIVQGFYVSMSGRDGAVKGVAFATLAVVTAGFFAIGWILQERSRAAVAFYAIPLVAAAFAAIKLLLSGRVMQAGIARGVFSRKQLMVAAIAWDLGVFAIYSALAWILPAILVRRDLLLLAAMLVVPFVRLAATPLAVARNRHA